MVGKIFDKRVNNRLDNHLEQGALFSDFQYGFRSSSTAEVLKVASAGYGAIRVEDL